jgi:hypothetical protein
MTQPLAHLYALALRALDEQERRVDAVRGRLGPVLAAAALGTTLLTGPVLGGEQPPGSAGTVAIAVAIIGLLVTLSTSAYLLGTSQLASFDANVHRLTTSLRQDGLLDDLTLFYGAMIASLGEQLDKNERGIRRLQRAFTCMLSGILVMQCGLTLATIVG